jgi:hypothetical protein
VLDRGGALRASLATGLTQPHGLTPDTDRGTDGVWICDIGVRIERNQDGTHTPAWSDTGGRVVRVRLSDGVTEEALATPPSAVYRTQRYSPTGCALDGDHVWVADGYGAGLVHRFSNDGTLELTLDGATEGVGRFACPHGCLVDRRR